MAMDNVLMSQIIQVGLILCTFLFAITVHEFSHALAAYLLGDDTARNAGRLTLNPLAHIDVLGIIFLLLFRIGWARPVPMDPRNFKYPRFYAVLSGLAGPFSNFVFAIFSLYGLKWLAPFYSTTSVTLEIFKFSAYVNVMLGVFNLLPIPPLDGSHLLQAFIPVRWRYAYHQFQFVSIVILFILLMIPTFQLFLMQAIQEVYRFLHVLVI